MENLVWAAIRDANNQVGDWTLRWYATPPGEEKPDGERVGSGLRVTATNQKTGEVRTHELPGRLPRLPPALGEEYPEIFKALGLFAELWMDSPHRFFISRRSPQGWPVYTRIIPRLYDLMAPHYKSRAHYSEKLDLTVKDTVERPARYPRQLLDDMLAIPKMHQPHGFEKTTTNQLKAAIQRHLSRHTTRPRRTR